MEMEKKSTEQVLWADPLKKNSLCRKSTEYQGRERNPSREMLGITTTTTSTTTKTTVNNKKKGKNKKIREGRKQGLSFVGRGPAPVRSSICTLSQSHSGGFHSKP